MLHNLQWVISPIPTTYIVKAILEKKKMGPIIKSLLTKLNKMALAQYF
jgi:hypothetical protein